MNQQTQDQSSITKCIRNPLHGFTANLTQLQFLISKYKKTTLPKTLIQQFIWNKQKDEDKIVLQLKESDLEENAQVFYSQLIIISLVTMMEAYLQDTFLFLLNNQPKLLMSIKQKDDDSGDRQFHATELLKYENEKIIDILPKIYVERKDFQKIEKVQKLYKNFFDIDIFKDARKEIINELLLF